ncbi:MAG: penicillin acylase family protein [Flavobacteriales bacterium]|nr:penicillin acylase family protein [Flavobacteriales bacterium]
MGYFIVNLPINAHCLVYYLSPYQLSDRSMRFPHLLIAALFVVPMVSWGQIDPKDVTIVRDSFGVPHIFGITDADAAYGLAWAHSEDDFEHIQHNILTGKRMLGQVLGKEGVLFDFGLQLFSIDSLVDARYELDLSADYRKVLEAYVQGLNDYAAAHPKEVLLKKSLPFIPQDLVKGYVLNTSLMAGVGLTLKAVNEGRIDEFFNVNTIGSNGLAVAPQMMDDGMGYLNINSHQPLEGRVAWYEAHISSEEGWDIIGGLFPAGMTVFVGTNRHLGWAHTVNFHVFGDAYQLEINPKNRKQYRYDGEWRDFYVKKAKLKVKVAGMRIPVSKRILVTTYGPVFETKKYGKYALRFPSYTDIRAAEQWYRMNKATDLIGFKDALKMQALPLFNVVYGDKDGNIMMHSAGKIPLRNPALDWKLPIKANISAFRWTEIIPFDRMPHVENPDCGYVYNANNTPLHCTGEGCNPRTDFPGIQNFEYNRGEVFRDLFASHQGLYSEQQVEGFKYNTSYHRNGSYADRFKALYELDAAKYPDISDAIAKMKHWNWRGDADDRDAALAMVTHDHLMRAVDAPFGLLMIRDRRITEEEAVDALRKAKKLLVKKHGSIDIPLGQVQRHQRGNVSLPAHGLREVPRAADAKLYDKKRGLYHITNGDGYIQKVRFSKVGPIIHSINAFGASAHPDSPHFTDQMELFVNQQYKPMTFDRAEIERNAERIYHPGE